MLMPARNECYNCHERRYIQVNDKSRAFPGVSQTDMVWTLGCACECVSMHPCMRAHIVCAVHVGHQQDPVYKSRIDFATKISLVANLLWLCTVHHSGIDIQCESCILIV